MGKRRKRRRRQSACWMCRSLLQKRPRPRSLLCNRCRPRAADEVGRERALVTLSGCLFEQSHISKRNMEIVEKLCASGDPEVADAARVVREVGRIKPAKRRRFKVLREHHPELLHRLKEHFGWDAPACGWDDTGAWGEFPEPEHLLVGSKPPSVA